MNIFLIRIGQRLIPIIRQMLLDLMASNWSIPLSYRIHACQNILSVVIFHVTSIYYFIVCSHPSVGKVSKAFFHQDGFQHVRVHHSQHGHSQLIHSGYLHTHIYILGIQCKTLTLDYICDHC